MKKKKFDLYFFLTPIHLVKHNFFSTSLFCCQSVLIVDTLCTTYRITFDKTMFIKTAPMYKNMLDTHYLLY